MHANGAVTGVGLVERMLLGNIHPELMQPTRFCFVSRFLHPAQLKLGPLARKVS